MTEYRPDFGRGSLYDEAFEQGIESFWKTVEKVYRGRVFPGDLPLEDDIRFGAECGRAILLWLAARHPDIRIREEAMRRARDLE